MKFGTFKYAEQKYGITPLVLELFETIGVTDFFNGVKVRVIYILESIGILDSKNSHTYASRIEAMNIVDNLRKSPSISRIESISVTDVYSSILTKVMVYIESIGVHDKIQKFLNGLPIVWDIVAKDISDVWNRASHSSSDIWSRVEKSVSDTWSRISKP